jgi:hypothetical protein
MSGRPVREPAEIRRDNPYKLSWAQVSQDVRTIRDLVPDEPRGPF